VTRPILDRLRRRWGTRWAGLALAGAGLAGLSVAGLLWRLSWPMVPSATAAWTAALVALAFLRLSRPPLTRGAVASHLNRWLPEVQDSADLLVDDPTDLTPVERLQRDRIVLRLTEVEPRTISPPSRLYRTPLVTTLSAGVVGVAIWLWPGAASPTGGSRSVTAHPPRPAPTIAAVRLEVSPPDYTGIPHTVTTDWDLDVPEGSRITWNLTAAHEADAVWLQTVEGDSLPLAPLSVDKAERFIVSFVPAHSTVYRVVAVRGSETGTTDYHRLIVRPDLPPALTILEPVARVSLTVDEPRLVTLVALAHDDYGLETPDIVVTVATGYGEGVQFRESVRRFTRVEERNDTLRLTEQFDLNRLGMKPGDELYLYLRARDNREPVANTTRTETVIVALEDTSTVVVSQPQGLAVDRMPDFFRSQRQIIIDTERLLADRGRIDGQAFNDRAQNIGLDQYLLRLRYSELVGDEFEDIPLGLVEEDIEALGIESAAPPEPLPELPPAQEGEDDESDDPSEEFLHDHDDAENATRLAATIKSTLKLALAEMWQAEIRLRTHRPEPALPYEQRALEILKRVQQAARSYVLRTGFDPPPIDTDLTRLTGDLEEVEDRTVRTSAGRAPTTPDRDVRQALHVVQQLQIGASTDSGAPATLMAGGRILARRALGEPLGYIEALGAIRELADSLAAGASCAHCLSSAALGLYRALPEAVPARPETRPAESGMARSYFDRLTGAP